MTVNNFQITANDKMSARTLSPMSGLVSWPNCTSAPRNRLTFVNALDGSCSIDGVVACGVAAAEAGGGVEEPIYIHDTLFHLSTLSNGNFRNCLPLTMGEELPLRLDLWDCNVLWWCGGDMGDFGATALALSGESGVLHWSLLPENEMSCFWMLYCRNYIL